MADQSLFPVEGRQSRNIHPYISSETMYWGIESAAVLLERQVSVLSILLSLSL